MTTGICPQGHLVTRRSPLVGAMMGPAFASGCKRTASVDDPAMAGPLGEIWIAAPEAKVTFIEYAAVTCTHCAAVHSEVWPGIKARWIDTGRTRFALRGYPLTPLGTAAFMLARADGGRNDYPITDLLFERQRFWAFVDKPLDAMRDLLRQAGFHRARFDAVLADQALYEQVNRVQAGAMKVLNVHTTPILYLNGDRHEGALPADAFDAIARKRSG
ncbi:DsbA family protein [Methylobacterium sp. J-030]|uniref:thioredoxin domain-containing protein n=1 Tax=Methylobacterium sp. J-030 TaxID=2836627 RepID=UPI001FB9B716|nr:thioredoxin domain-containing protein [Methylobacterium sp. J-030]MCJ2074004.1 DsbA family protein [Methylobacterium sp. J-030]